MRSIWRLMLMAWASRPLRIRFIISQILLVGVVGVNLLIPALVRRIIDEGIDTGDLELIVETSLLMVGLAFIGLILAIANDYLSVGIGVKMAHLLRVTLYKKVQTLSFGNLDRYKTSDLIVRLTSDVNISKQTIIMSLISLTKSPVMLVGAVLMVYFTIPELFWVMLVTLVAITVMLIGYLKVAAPMYLEIQHRLDRLNQVLEENLEGVRVVKAFVRSRYEIDRFDERNQDLRNESLRPRHLSAVLYPTIYFCVNLGTISALWFGGNLAIEDGSVSIGQIVAFTSYLSTATLTLIIIAWVLPEVAAASASLHRIFRVIDIEPDVLEKDDLLSLPDQIKGRVTFENVSFSYVNDDGTPSATTVLKDINLDVEPGQTVAILGATGSGKTSLVSLIPRFYDVTKGRVMIDGVDVRDVSLKELREQVVMALQQSMLFSGTVRQNIAYGRESANEDEIITVAQIADADEFISVLSGGYDAAVDRGGNNFSGGQRQRIAIARAIILNPKILILDDSTSAVDVETETRIQEGLQQLLKDTTTLIIAQRISTAMVADKIVVLENGEIVAEGAHSDLLKSSAVYQEIYASQFGTNGVKPAGG